MVSLPARVRERTSKTWANCQTSARARVPIERRRERVRPTRGHVDEIGGYAGLLSDLRLGEPSEDPWLVSCTDRDWDGALALVIPLRPSFHLCLESALIRLKEGS